MPEIHELPQVPNIPHFKRESIPEHIREECMQIFFRQSLIQDYLSCPLMSYFRWVLGLEQQSTFFAALLGTAGHEVIYWMHKERQYETPYVDLYERFCQAFNTALIRSDAQPAIGKDYDTLEDQLAAEAPYYVALLQTYQAHTYTRSFNSTMHEQSFVLELPGDHRDPHSIPYLFTGQIDQGGFYDDGTFAVRDIKFRDNAFRPSRMKLDIDIQVTVYATALRYGKPACDVCKPRYRTDPLTQARTLVYSGPCDSCMALINTARWPQKYAERCELIWMFDFETHKKDQYDEEVIDYDLPKIPNPKGKGPKVYQRKVNPQWMEGYKAGDQKNPGYIRTNRTPTQISVFMSDVLQIADSVRRGEFYRRPSELCSFWCKYTEQCRSALETQVQEIDLSTVKSYGTEDPF